MRTSSPCSCSCCGSITRPTCSCWAAKWPRCTIWSGCGARSGCNSAEKQVGGGCHVNRATSSNLPNLHNLPRLSYLGLMSTAGPLRQPIPVARSILWSPAGEDGGGQRPGHLPFPVFLAQSALTAIHEHVAAPARPGQGVLGFLFGDLCECPETNVSYLVIDAALRLNQAIYGDRTRDVITRLWDRVQEQLETQHAHLIGWYHTHPPLPLSLTEHDVETHEQYFGEPWQVALLLGTDPEEPAAGFFRAGPDGQPARRPTRAQVPPRGRRPAAPPPAQAPPASSSAHATAACRAPPPARARTGGRGGRRRPRGDGRRGRGRTHMARRVRGARANRGA